MFAKKFKINDNIIGEKAPTYFIADIFELIMTVAYKEQ